MKTSIILLAFISFISMVSSTFFGKLGANPYGTSISNVRPDIPYNNYGYGYGYQGYQNVYNRPFYSFGNQGYGSSYSYPNTGYFGSSLYNQNPFGFSSGYSSGYNSNPYYSGRPYSFFPSSYRA